MPFKKDFVWGAATASYQIEGAAFEDGKGLNIWDVFCMDHGKVFNDHNGNIACDHYHRFKEDISIMHMLGIKAYRFSLSWARLIPDGIGEINKEGIRFYNELIDALLTADIEPYITLFHWDYPYALYKKGAWLNDESSQWFGNYAKIVAENFSDRVKNFFTINEPQCFIGLGFNKGIHAPGLRVPYKDLFEMSHNTLKAHGTAVQMLREYAKQDIRIGLAPTGAMAYPDTNTPEDIEAARRYTFDTNVQISDLMWNIAWWCDPIFKGIYPEDALKKFSKYLPKITPADMKLISEPLDFYGQNIYNALRIRKNKNSNEPEIISRYEGFPKTALNWPVTPECLYWGPKFLYERYGKPILITENGLACNDVLSLDGIVHDPNRIDFMKRYLQNLQKASDDGVDVEGYFHWSLLDNFEWHSGYAERFGLVYVDYQTQQRIPKESAQWYSQIIHDNGASLSK